MKKLGGIAIVAAAAVLMVQGNAKASPSLLNPHETWSTDGAVEGWTADPGTYGTVLVSHNDVGDFLQISVTGDNGLPGNGRAITTGPVGTTYFTGDYTSVSPIGGYYPMTINFDFITMGTTPGDLFLYFQSGSGPSAHVWAYDVAGLNGTPISTGTTKYAVPVGLSGWFQQAGPVGDLATDWTSVSWLGVYVSGVGAATEIYGLDEAYVNLSVPEPETVWMILAAFLSICVTFRGKITEIAEQMKARVQ